MRAPQLDPNTMRALPKPAAKKPVKKPAGAGRTGQQQSASILKFLIPAKPAAGPPPRAQAPPPARSPAAGAHRAGLEMDVLPSRPLQVRCEPSLAHVRCSTFMFVCLPVCQSRRFMP